MQNTLTVEIGIQDLVFAPCYSTVSVNYHFCRFGNKIKFYDINDFTRALHIHSVAPHRPGRVCAISESAISYVDHICTPAEVHLLDCRTLPPKTISVNKSLYLPKSMWWDMCFVSQQNKKLLIVASAEMGGIEAYNIDTGSMEWKGQLDDAQKCAVASDGHGHIYVCDQDAASRCIHMLSASDGTYQGCLIREGEHGIGIPAWATWSEETSSLIVIHKKEDKRFFSVIYIQTQ